MAITLMHVEGDVLRPQRRDEQHGQDREEHRQPPRHQIAEPKVVPSSYPATGAGILTSAATGRPSGCTASSTTAPSRTVPPGMLTSTSMAASWFAHPVRT